MKSNVIKFGLPDAAAVDRREPLDAAVLDVSGRVATLNDERRRLFTRLDELRGSSPSLRRRRARVLPLSTSRPVTFYSIEEASASSESGPLQAA
jgi:hypothetical protein